MRRSAAPSLSSHSKISRKLSPHAVVKNFELPQNNNDHDNDDNINSNNNKENLISSKASLTTGNIVSIISCSSECESKNGETCTVRQYQRSHSTQKNSNDINRMNCSKISKGSSNSFSKKVFSVPFSKIGNGSNVIGSNVSYQETDKATVDENEKNTQIECYFSVMWCKASSKKHKKWEGDGILIVNGKSVVLKDIEGTEVAKSSGCKSSELACLVVGSTLVVSGKEIEIQGVITKELYLSGKCFTSTVSKIPIDDQNELSISNVGVIKPFLAHNVCSRKIGPISYIPRYDPTKEGALVMPNEKTLGNPLENVDVVVDPFISSNLRPHQREGVTFLYECIMGRKVAGHGAILADDMGLGKTLQCIALVWTLLKQGPYKGVPVAKKVIIITPGSLVKNWHKEFIKWLGSERVKPFVVESKNRVDICKESIKNIKNCIKNFQESHHKEHEDIFKAFCNYNWRSAKEFLLCSSIPVMIISYEMFLRCIEDIRKVKFDLIICDEAHRLKNLSIKTASFIASLAIKRRILLTGTPIQNNLDEFFALAELANPGVLGSQNIFRRTFVEPITRSQQPDCSNEEKELGESKAMELNDLTKSFCLRRTADINKIYLPAKVEYVLFIQMSELQMKIYTHIINCYLVQLCNSTSYNGCSHLRCIGMLKKLCNDPVLVYNSLSKQAAKDCPEDYSNQSLLNFFVHKQKISSMCNSAKLRVLHQLLNQVINSCQKMVLVSNSTKTLDLLEKFCQENNIVSVRLDGQTQVQMRQQLIDRFNDRQSNVTVFLLSSKAGGVGLNLVGASNLVLYDIDWNPANDLQGTIEEKIYQRQIIKQALSKTVVDSLVTDKTEFSQEDLKDLFTFQESSTCLTHDLLNCSCLDNKESEYSYSKRFVSNSNEKSASMAELMRWEHISKDNIGDIMGEELSTCSISFIFRNRSI